jgi:hypothetical protein
MDDNIHISKLVLQKLKDEKRTVTWLAREIDKDPSNLRKRLKKGSIDTELLQQISKALHFHFFQYLDTF